MSKYALVFGCSHTSGVSVGADHCYVKHLDKHYDNINFVNKGIGGCNSRTVLEELTKSLNSEHLPSLVICQWPNPIRTTRWTHHDWGFMNINNSDHIFKLLYEISEKNFIMPWLLDIKLANLICRFAQVPIINILLENIDTEYKNILAKQGIILHCDEKVEGKTWIFDSAAPDKRHHSERCHKLWAERLIGIIDEITTR